MKWCCDFLVILQGRVIDLRGSAGVGGIPGVCTDISGARTWYPVPWAKWCCPSVTVVALFSCVGFGDCKKLEVTSGFLPPIPPRVGFLSLFSESAWSVFGFVTCLDPCNTAEMMLCDFRRSVTANFAA